MKSPLRWLRRRRELAQNRPRMLEAQDELSRHLGTKVSLRPASAKGGYDEIYLAHANQGPIAVVRINSQHKSDTDPIGQWDPGIPLGPKERLDKEWTAYQALHPHGLSPEPLWRNEFAIACSWLPSQRASRQLRKSEADFWGIVEEAFQAISTMHRSGVTHLDLNTGNLLLENGSGKVIIIDFEFGPADWVTPPQQRLFDYLRLIDDLCKKRRGGDYLQKDIGRICDLLDQFVAPEDRGVDLDIPLKKLSRLGENPELTASLARVLTG